MSIYDDLGLPPEPSIAALMTSRAILESLEEQALEPAALRIRFTCQLKLLGGWPPVYTVGCRRLENQVKNFLDYGYIFLDCFGKLNLTVHGTNMLNNVRQKTSTATAEE